MRACVRVLACLHVEYFFCSYIWNKDLVFSSLSRFNSRNFSATPFVLRESPHKDNGGWIHFDKVENNERLCSIPYHKDFKLVSFNIFKCRILILHCYHNDTSIDVPYILNWPPIK